MSYLFLNEILTPAAIQANTKSCIPNGDWVSYRHPSFEPNSVSPHEGRFHDAGTTAYYLASGLWVAQKEVPTYTSRDLYKVSSNQIDYLDLYQLSLDQGVHDQFLKAKQDNGWKLCQAVAAHLTTNYSLSAILYESYQAHTHGLLGFNMVVLPQRGQLVGDTFFIKHTLTSLPDGTL